MALSRSAASCGLTASHAHSRTPKAGHRQAGGSWRACPAGSCRPCRRSEADPAPHRIGRMGAQTIHCGGAKPVQDQAGRQSHTAGNAGCRFRSSVRTASSPTSDRVARSKATSTARHSVSVEASAVPPLSIAKRSGAMSWTRFPVRSPPHSCRRSRNRPTFDMSGVAISLFQKSNVSGAAAAISFHAGKGGRAEYEALCLRLNGFSDFSSCCCRLPPSINVPAQAGHDPRGSADEKACVVRPGGRCRL